MAPWAVGPQTLEGARWRSGGAREQWTACSLLLASNPRIAVLRAHVPRPHQGLPHADKATRTGSPIQPVPKSTLLQKSGV